MFDFKLHHKYFGFGIELAQRYIWYQNFELADATLNKCIERYQTTGQ